MVTVDSCIYVLGGNHAIDETVSTQLLRFCPDQVSAAGSELSYFGSLVGQYHAGTLVLELPENISGISQLMLFDIQGRSVFFEKLLSGIEGHYERWIGELTPMVYLIQLRTQTKVYTGKVFVY